MRSFVDLSYGTQLQTYACMRCGVSPENMKLTGQAKLSQSRPHLPRFLVAVIQADGRSPQSISEFACQEAESKEERDRYLCTLCACQLTK